MHRSVHQTLLHRAARSYSPQTSISRILPSHFYYRTATAFMPPKRRREDFIPVEVAYPYYQVGPSDGAYLVPAPDQHPAPSKRARKSKAKDPDAPVEEKRLARVKANCPQNILDRVDRVMTQRFFMIDRERDGDELRETFKVLGSTGNVYTVVIDKIPACDCPDAQKGNHCKHILFIFLKVMGVPQHSTYYYQKALLSTELADIFNSAPPSPTSLAAQRVRDAYKFATGASTEPPKDNRRLPTEGDDCPICYEPMPVAKDTGLVFCRTCGNPLHKECFQQWAKQPQGGTCVTCRAAWSHESQSTSPKKGTVSSEGYVNIAQVAGISPVRDTSTYYNGPRRGQRGSYYEGEAFWD